MTKINSPLRSCRHVEPPLYLRFDYSWIYLQSGNPILPKPVQEGWQARKWCVLSMSWSSLISSGVKSMIFALSEENDEWQLRLMVKQRLTQDTFVGYGLGKHCVIPLRTKLSSKNIHEDYAPVCMGLFAWRDINTLAGCTPYFAAIFVTVWFFNKGELSDPSGE